MSENERNTLINKYSDIFELTADLAKPISEYSHGMKQKLVVISALIHKPRLMLLDEPFVGLDPKASHTLKQLMKDICSSGGAIFFSTHVLEVAEKLCDKIAIIRNGALIVHAKRRGDGKRLSRGCIFGVGGKCLRLCFLFNCAPCFILCL